MIMSDVDKILNNAVDGNRISTSDALELFNSVGLLDAGLAADAVSRGNWR